MRVGIVGLGLIGGSLAKAFSRDQAVSVLGWDQDDSILAFAQIAGAIDGILDETSIQTCDCVMIALYPQAVIDYLTRMAAYIDKETIVLDCCGTKEKVCAACFPIAEQYGFTFLGGHPMAGTHNSGFLYSDAELFESAPMVIVPPSFDNIRRLDRVKTLLRPVGFGRITVTTAKEHDARIAFTSQMAHVISNAFIKSPTAVSHQGFSAGSYKDMTRVAWLNPDMWAELFLENQENLLFELDVFLKEMQKYREAIETNDFNTLRDLLYEGRCRKELVEHDDNFGRS
ncbi:MAG: prephenate dehydrogenase [Evtepia sp.]